jgi:LuxR family maltose regulon positive regulatory protein
LAMGRQRPQHILISTKINRPAVNQKWVNRPRLLSRLNEGRQKRVTLISAPAGYGKSTLVVQWLYHVSGNSAWLSLEKSDSDPDRFLKYVIASIRKVFPKFGLKIESLLSSPTLPPPDYSADTLIADLAALNKPLVIVLDDFHTIVSEPAQMILTRVVQYQPDNLYMVILTRIDPPLPIGLWRVREWLNEVRAADLRFTRDEARDFFNLNPENAISAETVDMLQSRTEGWVAGLQLAQLSLTDADNPDQHAGSFSGKDRYVVDFLVEEVISKQPAEIRDFLAVTAGFDRFCAPLCDFTMGSKSGSHNSRKLITLLERGNLFLVPLDSERGWYRYHHLFQSLLVQHLKDNISPEHKVRLHQRAGEWFAGQGLIEEALKYLLAAGDVEKAAELVELNLDETLDKDLSRRTLRRWLDMFPKAVEKKQPALLVARAYCKAHHWDFDGMILLMDDAEALLRNPACIVPKSRRQTLLNHIDAQRTSYLYWQGDAEGALRHGQRALNNTPKKYRHLLLLAVMYAGAAYALNGLRDKGLQLLSDATSKARSEGSGYAGAYLAVQMGIFFYAGDLAAVKQTAEQILELYKSEAVHAYWLCPAHYFLGAAAQFQCVEQMRYRTNTRPYHDCLIGLALVALAQGRLAAAREHTVSARSFALEMNDAYSLSISDSFETRFAIVSGEIPAQPVPHVPTVESNHLWLETPFLTHVEYLLSKANPVDCLTGLKYVENALKEVRQHHNTRQLIKLLAVKAVALKSAGRLADALQTLEKTLRMAEPLGFVRTFVDWGLRMAELLNALLERRPENAYARSLLDAFEGKTPSRAEPTADELPSGALSNRELDVLIMLAERLSNKEIAEQLFVSPETVKKHTANIYRKLNVPGRRPAVAAARKLGLFPLK